MRKHVISTNLTGDLGWNSALVEGDPIQYVRRLRDQEGGGVSVAGGIETVRSLFLAGPVDVLTLTVHPVVTGEGRRLFDTSVPLTRLRLVDSTVTPAGNAVSGTPCRTDAPLSRRCAASSPPPSDYEPAMRRDS